MAKNINEMIGTWRIADKSSDVIYRVSVESNRIRMEAVDTYDGEKLVVTGVRFEQGTLRFKTFCRSNGFRAAHKFTALSKNRLRQEMTIIENWIRADESAIEGAASTNQPR